MNALLLSIGDEVVAGQIADTNAAWLAERLLDLGVDVIAHEAVRDVVDEIEDAVHRAAARVDLVVATGGLGPTEDDLSRHGIAGAAGVGLELDEASLQHIRDRFYRYGRAMPERNRIQAMIPEGATVLPNTQGTAPGFAIAIGSALVAVMPGVPREMKAMFDLALSPLIEAMPHERRVVRVERVRLYRVPESLVNEKIRHLMDRDANPLVGLLVSGGVISVKFTAAAESQEAAAALIAPVREEVEELLGEQVFGHGDDTLEQVVARELERTGCTVAVAESCTGGLIGHYLTQVPGISDYFLEDLVTYSNEAKVDLLGVSPDAIRSVGAVSEEVAAAMAEGVRARSGADVAISTTGIAGPGGGSEAKPVGLVYMGLASEQGTVVERFTFVGDRAVVKDRAAKAALDMLRLHLKNR